MADIQAPDTALAGEALAVVPWGGAGRVVVWLRPRRFNLDMIRQVPIGIVVAETPGQLDFSQAVHSGHVVTIGL